MEKRKVTVKVEAQTWHNVPPYPDVTLYRARVGEWTGQWWAYAENARSEGERHRDAATS
jgi:hypothetical protein